MMFSYKTDSDVLVRVFEWPSHPGTCWEPTVPPWGLQVESSPAPCWERTDPPWGLQVDSSPAPCWDRTDTPSGLQFESSPAPCWDRRGPSSLSWTGVWTRTGPDWLLLDSYWTGLESTCVFAKQTVHCTVHKLLDSFRWRVSLSIALTIYLLSSFHPTILHHHCHQFHSTNVHHH